MAEQEEGSKAVLSFGEVLMDCFPDKKVIGGAPFNVVTHLSRLGVKSGIITKVGSDALGEEIEAFLKNESIGALLQVDHSYPTGQVDVSLKNGQPSYNIHKGTAWEFIDFKHVTTPEYVVFGSLALCFSHNFDTFKRYADTFKSAVFVCDLNLRSPYFTTDVIEYCLQVSQILKINDEELDYLARLFGIRSENVIEYLQNKYEITKVLLTEGAKGATLFWEGSVYKVQVPKLDYIEDTVGAGDSFTAVFLKGVILNTPFDQTLKKAADFAGIICQTKGAIPSDLDVYKGF